MLSNEKSKQHAHVPKRQRVDTESDHECGVSDEKILKGLSIYIFPTGIGSSRVKVFKTQITKLGGCFHDKISHQTTHVIVDESVTFEKISKVMKWDNVPAYLILVKSLWLSSCIKEKALLDTKGFELKILHSKVQSPCRGSAPHVTETKSVLSEICSAQSSSNTTDSDLPEKSHYICSVPSSQSSINPNKHITDKLEVLAQMYKSTQDYWRAVGYEKAIIALKNYPKPVMSWEEAKSLPGVGDRLADKIYEIIQSGNLRKIEETCAAEKVAAISLFNKVWGIGPSLAAAFVQQGFSSLTDLRTKAKLSEAQQIGLKYFDELQERMPREEAFEIFSVVEEQVKIIDSNLMCVLCGSYRRNRETCGDVDILITHPDGKSHVGVLPKVVSALHISGLLTDDLVSQEENKNQKKYMGICKLSGENKIHRRIDIIVLPYEEYACALVHFTGSAYFNRSIRLLAARKNMSLSEHWLKADVVRKGQDKITDGRVLPTPTEESIFEHLGLKYRLPEERDHFALE